MNSIDILGGSPVFFWYIARIKYEFRVDRMAIIAENLNRQTIEFFQKFRNFRHFLRFPGGPHLLYVFAQYRMRHSNKFLISNNDKQRLLNGQKGVQSMNINESPTSIILKFGYFRHFS